ERASVRRASQLAEAAAGLFSTNALAAAPIGGHDEPTGSPAQPAAPNGIRQADDSLGQLAVLRAQPASTTTRLAGPGQDVLEHHLNSTRDGLYIDPLLTQKAAANTHRDQTFDAPLPGPTYAQPLYVSNGPDGRPTFVVATERNVVLALDAT